MRRPATPRFRYDRPPSRASDAARANALPGPRALRLLRGGAPAVIGGGGRGVGKEAVCARQSGGMDVAKQRVFPPTLAPSPSAFPLRPAMRTGWLAYINKTYTADAVQHGPALGQGELVVGDDE